MTFLLHSESEDGLSQTTEPYPSTEAAQCFARVLELLALELDIEVEDISGGRRRTVFAGSQADIDAGRVEQPTLELWTDAPQPAGAVA